MFTTVVVVSGSLLRPIGGWLSDRFGGYRLLVTLLTGFAVCLGFVATGVAVASGSACSSSGWVCWDGQRRGLPTGAPALS